MSNHVPLFQFRLSSGQSIGPGMLRRLWATACSTEDVTVSREIRKLGILGKGLGPVHRKAVANAKRLARTKLR